MMRGTRRIGLLGGTFDPIHIGHLDAAEAARRALALDEILVIPAHDPPQEAGLAVVVEAVHRSPPGVVSASVRDPSKCN